MVNGDDEQGSGMSDVPQPAGAPPVHDVPLARPAGGAARRRLPWALVVAGAVVVTAVAVTVAVMSRSGSAGTAAKQDPTAPIISGPLAVPVRQLWLDCRADYHACGTVTAGPSDILEFCNQLPPPGTNLPLSQPSDLQPVPAYHLPANDAVTGPSHYGGGMTVECSAGDAADGWSVQIELPSARSGMGPQDCGAGCMHTPAGDLAASVSAGVSSWLLNSSRASVVLFAEGASVPAGAALFDAVVQGVGLPSVAAYLTGDVGQGVPAGGDAAAASGGQPARVPSSPAAPTAQPGGTAVGQPRVVHGNDGLTYSLNVVAEDRLTDCAAHAYGKVVSFLRTHPCRGSGRLLASVTVGGRTADVTIIKVAMGSATASTYADAADAYRQAARLAQLEQQAGTGGMNDLLRDGHTLAGVHGGIPAHEAFSVFYQDAYVEIFDAWWASGRTGDQDGTLLGLEHALVATGAEPWPS